MSAKDMRKLMESITPVINESTGCDCGPDCKCGGSCGGKCGDEGCPCECGERTGVGINECSSSIYESVQLNESSVYEESKFISIMSWFMAPSGMPAKHEAADQLKKKFPEATPWEWTSGFKVYLRAQKLNEQDDHGGYGNAEMQASADFHDHEMDTDDEEPFDWHGEMESGIVISDNTRGGYDVSADGKYIDNYSDWKDAILAVKQWMEQNQYYPNMFFVNDHGNVTHIDTDGNEIDSIVEKETEKYAKRKPYKDSPPATNEPMSPADIDFTTPDPEKVSQTAARAALHGKETTHGDTNRSGDQPTGWATPSITGFAGTMPNPKTGGVYSPAKAWLALMKQPDTVTLYRYGKGHWDITQGGYMVQKGTPDAWAYIQNTRPTGPIIVVDMKNKFVKRIALD